MEEFVINWKKVYVIFKKELRYYFYSPIAYIFICLFLIVMGWLFFSRFFLYNQMEMRDFFNLLPVVLSFIIPAITMGIFSQEFNIGSYEIISTTSVSVFDIIIGKFLGATTFLCIALLPTLLYPIVLSFIGDLDWGPIIGGYIGSIFLIGGLVSIGIFASSLTKDQIVSFIISLVIFVFLTFILSIMKPLFPLFIINFIDIIAADSHFYNIARGMLDLRDIIYFLSVIFIFLYSTKLVLDQRK